MSKPGGMLQREVARMIERVSAQRGLVEQLRMAVAESKVQLEIMESALKTMRGVLAIGRYEEDRKP